MSSLACRPLRAALLFAVAATAVSAQSWSTPARITAAGLPAGSRFGAAVSLSGHTLVLGAPDDSTSTPYAGSAYVFLRQDGVWRQQARLTGPATEGYRSFGETVAVDGDTLVVGAPFDDPDGYASGAAYVYGRSGTSWQLRAVLRPADPAEDKQFGHAVAIDNDVIVVGAFLDSDYALYSGAAYVFTSATGPWTQVAKLTASDPSEVAFFGSAVAIQDHTIVVGAPVAESAYVFGRRSGRYVQVARLRSNDYDPDDTYVAFGAAVSVDAGRIAVGAPLAAFNGVQSGAAYVFGKSGSNWVQQARVLAQGGQPETEFGTAVALRQNTLVVGAPYEGDQNQGAVFVYQLVNAEWTQNARLTAPAKPAVAFLGISVAAGTDGVVGGAPGYSYEGATSVVGAAEVFAPR
ncbi:FG-GAP repeat protein [Opitutus terrae]|uniref:Integrin alpha beta-propellor repeat protein n=1 Tax=Opitutus terrae (strain DSM 11246 / JCM 15787 / PB90-1) TaxID=452637 RepID=B1ZR00_OPITP|nr:FG-GAP repeat protein [Opitutus terrae]ACB73667.1 Integrin alpha beta-propellor repeat protein [Opitutus terrae PB90-1]